jgi:hypothetical protein
MTAEDPQGGEAAPVLPKREVFLNKADQTNRTFVREIHSNLSSDLIQITEDKALICLMQNFDRLRSRDAWQAPAGILATLATVMVTAAPTNQWGLSKETWTAIGLVSTVATAAWLIRDLFRRWTGKPVDPRSIVNELKTITATRPLGEK